MLPDALEKMIRQSLLKIHTSFPGTIVEYDDETLTATVESGFEYVVSELQPDGSRITKSRKYPLIKEVPISLPVFGKFQIRPPASEFTGATVLLVTSERALDNFMESGQSGDPEEPRIMELSDAIITGGLSAENNIPQRKGAKNSLEITYGDSYLEITEQGKIKIQSGENELIALMEAALDGMANAQYMDPSSGPLNLMPASRAVFTDLKNAISQMKGT